MPKACTILPPICLYITFTKSSNEDPNFAPKPPYVQLLPTLGRSQAIYFYKPHAFRGWLKMGYLSKISWIISTLLVDKMILWGIFQHPIGTYNL